MNDQRGEAPLSARKQGIRELDALERAIAKDKLGQRQLVSQSRPSEAAVPSRASRATHAVYPTTPQPPNMEEGYYRDDEAVPIALPSQEGPLSQYPSYANVDESGKWQRIQDWVVKDSNHASVEKTRSSEQIRDIDQIRDVEEDARSIGASILELEIMRASNVSGFKPSGALGLGPWALGQDKRASQQYPARQTVGSSVHHHMAANQEAAPSRLPHHRLQQSGNQMGYQSIDAERRRSDALEIEKLRSRIDILQQSMEGERMLASQAQQQLQAELLHVKSLTDSESAARAAEASLQSRLDQAKKTLEMEKKRSAEVSRAASASAQEQTLRITALEAAKFECEARLKAERDMKNRQARQLEAAAKNESDLRSQIVDLEARRDEQARRLDSSSGQIDSLRKEIRVMEARQASREEKLMKQVEDVEVNELASLRRKLEASDAALQQEGSSYAALRESILSIHHTLSPQQLASAFGYRDDISSSPAIAMEHQAIADRIAKNKHVSSEDVQFVSSAVRALLHQSQAVFLHAERRDVAIRSAADQATETLQAQIDLLTARSREAEDSFHSQMIEMEAALHDAEERLGAEVVGKVSLMSQIKVLESKLVGFESRHSEMMDEAAQFRSHAASDLKDLQEAKIVVDQALESTRQALQQALDESSHLDEQLVAKDKRLKELRTALSAASEANDQLTFEASEKHSAFILTQDQLATTESQLAEVRAKADELEKTLISIQQYGIDGDQERSALDRNAEASIKAALSSVHAHLRLLGCKERPLSSDGVISGVLSNLERDVKLTCNQAARSSLSLVPLVPLLSSSLIDLAAKTSSIIEEADRSSCLVSTSMLNASQSLSLSLGISFDLQEGSIMEHLMSLIDTTVSKLSDLSHQRDSSIARAQEAERELVALKDAVSDEWATLRLEAARAVQVSEEVAEAARREAADATLALDEAREENAALSSKMRDLERDLFDSVQANEALRSDASLLASELYHIQETTENHRQDVTGLTLKLDDVRQQLSNSLATTKSQMLQREQLALRFRLSSKRLALVQRELRRSRKLVAQLEASKANQSRALVISKGKKQISRSQEELATAHAQINDLDTRLKRAETLVPKLEERRLILESDKKVLSDKIRGLHNQVSSLTQAAEATHRSDAIARKEYERSTKAEALKAVAMAESKAFAAESRASELLGQLEAAEAALRGSLGTASRLHKEYSELRNEDQELRSRVSVLEMSIKPALSHQAASSAVGETADAVSAGDKSIFETLSSIRRPDASQAPAALQRQPHADDAMSLVSSSLVDASAAFSAKDQRILELRSMLSATMEERDSLQNKLEDDNQLLKGCQNDLALCRSQLCVVQEEIALLKLEDSGIETLESRLKVEESSNAHLQALCTSLQAQLQELLIYRGNQVEQPLSSTLLEERPEQDERAEMLMKLQEMSSLLHESLSRIQTLENDLHSSTVSVKEWEGRAEAMSLDHKRDIDQYILKMSESEEQLALWREENLGLTAKIDELKIVLSMASGSASEALQLRGSNASLEEKLARALDLKEVAERRLHEQDRMSLLMKDQLLLLEDQLREARSQQVALTQIVDESDSRLSSSLSQLEAAECKCLALLEEVTLLQSKLDHPQELIKGQGISVAVLSHSLLPIQHRIDLLFETWKSFAEAKAMREACLCEQVDTAVLRSDQLSLSLKELEESTIAKTAYENKMLQWCQADAEMKEKARLSCTVFCLEQTLKESELSLKRLSTDLASSVDCISKLEGCAFQINQDRNRLMEELGRQADEVLRLKSLVLQLENDLTSAHREAHSTRLGLIKERDDLSSRMADIINKLEESEQHKISLTTELQKSQKGNETLTELANRRAIEIKELNHLLRAWEAMRMGKDAQIASLIERGKRSEEDIAEKGRTIEALRRKITGQSR